MSQKKLVKQLNKKLEKLESDKGKLVIKLAKAQEKLDKKPPAKKVAAKKVIVKKVAAKKAIAKKVTSKRVPAKKTVTSKTAAVSNDVS